MLVLVSALGVAIHARQAPPAPQQTTTAEAGTPEFFEARIRPILAANCYDCHTDEPKAGLRLDSREAILKGGASGPAIEPGKPDASLLIKAVRREPKAPEMPSGRPKLKTG
jgi:Planctomycete cytochrome C